MAITINDKDHVKGSSDAHLEIVEYGDYECPYCGKAYYIMKEAKKKLGNKIKFVFRNFPLTEMHPYALNAAIASEVAAAKGKFWDMHDILFENQEHLDDSYLIQYAKAIGLDEEEFEKDFGNKEYYQKIKDDYNSGVENSVEGTPTFFINGKKYDGNWMSGEFIKELEHLSK